MTPRTIGFVYDLRSDYLAEGYSPEQVAEFDTESTIASVAGALTSLGAEVDRIGNGRALAARLTRGERWDLVFNVAEGLAGRCREAQVPALLELYDQPYTFSDPLTCALTLDKGMTKLMVQAAGLATPRGCIVAREADLAGVLLRYPLFAKPNSEGTGKGIDARSRVEDPRELSATCVRLLEEFAQPVLVEEYLPGREFTTGVLGTGPEARALGTMEVRILPGAPAQDYSYEVKEKCEQFVEYVPLEHGPLRERVEALAVASYRVLHCRDAARADIRLDAAGEPSFIEVNPLPGLHPTHSDLPMIATMNGMSYPSLLGEIVASAARRAGLDDRQEQARGA